MAYQATIVWASQDYVGLVWVQYDLAFRRQAALTGLTQWSAINPTLYTLCFAGSARTATRCKLCFAATHTTKEGVQQGGPNPGVRDCLCAIERAVLSMTPRPGPPMTPQPRAMGQQRAPSGEVCRNWNVNQCTFPYCRHSHVCSSCGEGVGGGTPPALARSSTRSHHPIGGPPQVPGMPQGGHHTPTDIGRELGSQRYQASRELGVGRGRGWLSGGDQAAVTA